MCGGREEGEGGGGGGRAAAAAAASPRRPPRAPRLPVPPLQQRRGPTGPGPAAAAEALEADAPGVFIRGRSRRARHRSAAATGAPGGLRGADGASWPELAGGGRAAGSSRGWLGSGPRSARGRLPLPPAPSSSEFHRRPPPAPRAPRLDGWQEGAAAAAAARGPLAPDFAPRLSRARLLQTLAALGAGLPRRAEPEPPVPPPLLRPAPRAPPLAAPPLGPGAGSAPRGRSPRARHRQLSLPPRASGPGSPRLPAPRAGAAGTATLLALPAVAASNIAPRQGKATRPAAWGWTETRPVSGAKNGLSGRCEGLPTKRCIK